MTLFIIDDHPVVLNGTKAILQPHFEVTTVEKPLETMRLLEQAMLEQEVKLCLIDVQMPEMSGIELCRMIRASYPEIKLILYTGYEVKDYAELVANFDVDGVISKTASKEQLIHCIEGVLLGNVVLPVELFTQLMRSRIDHVHPSKEVQLLNDKEIAILRYVAEGLTNKAIALEFQVSQRTIENHLTRIFEKLQVGSRAEALMKAKDLCLI